MMLARATAMAGTNPARGGFPRDIRDSWLDAAAKALAQAIRAATV